MNNLTARQNLDLIGELVKDPMDSIDALRLVGLDKKADNYLAVNNKESRSQEL